MKRLVLSLLCTVFLYPLSALEIGILDSTGTAGSSLRKTLEEEPENQIRLLSDMAPEQLSNLDVLIVQRHLDPGRSELLRSRVKAGMGILMTHDAAGSGRHGILGGNGCFPELIRQPLPNSVLTSRARSFRLVRKHPLTQGISTFTPPYHDYVIFAPRDDGQVLLHDHYTWQPQAIEALGNLFTNQSRWRPYRGRNAVMVAGHLGQGRVVLYGGLMGLDSKGKPADLIPMERKLLCNIVAWLTKTTPYGLVMTGKTEAFPPMSHPDTPPSFHGKSTVLGARLPMDMNAPESTWELTVPTRPDPARYHLVACPMTAPDSLVTVALYDQAQRLLSQVPGEIQANTLQFIAKLPQRKILIKLGPPLPARLLQVRRMAGQSAVEIAAPHFRVIAAMENQRPAIVSLQLFDREEHHTWDGQESMTWTAPLFRLSETLWPFRALPPQLYHERGMPLPPCTADLSFYGNRLDITLGKARLTVFPHGLLILRGFPPDGRISTWAFDTYRLNQKIVTEHAAPDMPKLTAPLLWAIKENRYALGGNLEILPAIGVTGMCPGVQRKIRLRGQELMINCQEDGPLQQIKNIPLRIQATVQPHKLTPASPQVPLALEGKALNLFSYLTRRGSKEFMPSKPAVLEILRHELPENLNVTTWKLQDAHDFSLSADWRPGRDSIPDQTLIQAMNKQDPLKEESYVYRRFFIRATQAGHIGTRTIHLLGQREDGRTVLKIPIAIRERITLPRGIFLYCSQWTSWHQEMPPEAYHKIFRDLRTMGFDYAIAQIDVSRAQTEHDARIAERLARNGIWWMAGFNGIWKNWYSSNIGKKTMDSLPSTELPDRTIARAMGHFKSTPNLWAYYLTDELAAGKTENGKLPLGYMTANHAYDLVRQQDPKRPAMNLISPHFTDYDTVARHLKTDWVSWDRYIIGARGVASDLKLVRKAFGPNRFLCETLRAGGPFWYDTAHLYLDIRTQGIAAIAHGVDSVNYYKYLQLRRSITWRDYGIVALAAQGVIATPRRQTLELILDEMADAITVEYLIRKLPEQQQTEPLKALENALAQGQLARFQTMHDQLRQLYRKLGKIKP